MSCFGFLKTMMFLFNGIIFLAGAALLGVGVWVKVDSGNFLSFLQNIPQAPGQMLQLLNVGYLLMVVGALLLILGFLACCGAVKESRCMLLTFFAIILMVFLAEVAGAIVLLVFKPLSASLIQQVGTDAVISIKADFGKNPDVTGLWNTTMTALQCCGFNNFTDFSGSPYVNKTQTYPAQCCRQAGCGSANASASAVPGCFPALKSLVDNNAVIIIGVALGIAALELASMIVSMILYCQIGSKRD